MITRRALGAHLGLETTAVGELFRRGIVSPEMTMAAARWAYLAHLREQAAGRRAQTEGAEVFDLVAERARLAAVQADGQQLKNAQMTGELIEVKAAFDMFARSVAAMKEKLRGVPNYSMIRVPGMTKEMARGLLGLIDEALEELASGWNPPEAARRHRKRRGTV
jgi:phage terminase Nu1 subunit (DNA packaging protein)